MTYNVLYVEDNRLNARLLCKYLEKYGFNVLIAQDAKRGFELIKEYDFDLIFLDINLPEIDGVTMLKTLKTSKKHKHIPTIALTANAMYGDKQNYLNEGFDEYLPKPLTRYEVDHKITMFLKVT